MISVCHVALAAEKAEKGMAADADVFHSNNKQSLIVN